MDINEAQLSAIFNFATEQGGLIVNLHLFVLAICVVIACLVSGILTAAAIRFRARPGDAEPVQNHGNAKLEIIWTVVPSIIVIVLAVLTAVVMGMSDPPVNSRQPDVIVNAHQFWWEYRYPKSGVVTANELYLPLGQDLLLEVRAADVAHSFWVYGFGQKMDAIPGHPNHVYFKPIKQGLFLGSCSEFCGADHALMRILAYVVPPDQFVDWIRAQQKIPSAGTEANSQRGAQLFVTHTCVQCHAIGGTSAKAQIGPDLTHLATRKTLGAGVLANNPENLARWIANPQAFKPGCYMPNMQISADDASDIAAYLESLK